ncbi:MAG: hypothetical protein WCP93_02195 [Candidatus Berkelbacteria bacterium]
MTHTDKSELYLTLRQNEHELYVIAEMTSNFQTLRIVQVFDKNDTRVFTIQRLEEIAQFYYGDGQFDHGYRGIIIEKDLHPPNLPCTDTGGHKQPKTKSENKPKHYFFGFAN